ncbi:hypothetical protein GCM10023216_23290 [Isoptericola chiayiensis]|uniref:Nitroreductase n=1 Tax=Isoptericola chiayiensis TaxID=579446 RepID=A0ABP8YL11_9MICO|nr:nitroreductase family deazaflavin-dependent oxidoreductase [Isoptericola chiayiensis]NOW00556.1 deazaflavin-dependent oxidoreductase (nitroreductase family) [Isoptericola chiayiensis]
MWQWITGIVGGALALAVAAGVGLVVTMRTKWDPGLRLVRRVNKRFTNPRVLGSAGGSGESTAVIHHVGRRSGREYATPIGPARTDLGLLVTLPYGPTTDWVRNVRAAGSARLDLDGATLRVTDPRLVDLDEAAPLLPAGERRVARIFGATDFLLLTVAPPEGTSVAEGHTEAEGAGPS